MADSASLGADLWEVRSVTTGPGSGAITSKEEDPMSVPVPATTRRSSLVLVLTAVVALGASVAVSAQGTGTPGVGIFLPFAPNQTWYVCQGHLNVIRDAQGEIMVQTHRDNFALDLTIDPGGVSSDGCFGIDDAATAASAGQPVYAPGPGVTTHLTGNAQDLVCLDLDRGGSLLLGHMDPASVVEDGRVEALELLGILDEPATSGGVNNGGYSHIHIEAFSNDSCSTVGSDDGAVEPHDDAETFAGLYRFFGVPDLPNQRDFSAVEDFENHYFGSGFSNLMILAPSDDAGQAPGGCSEGNGFAEIYLGKCDSGAQLSSGLRFKGLPVNKMEWISAASVVVQVDGRYTHPMDIEIRGQENAFAPTFLPGSMPSDRLDLLTEESVRWTVSDRWDLGETRDTPGLRDVLQQIVNRQAWTRDVSSFVLILSGAPAGTVGHRRFMATEREPTNELPAFFPARAVVTQFRTDDPDRGFKGNNPPLANAGPDIFYNTFGRHQVTLQGGQSMDPDGDMITYTWSKLDGPAGTFSDIHSPTPTFRFSGFGGTYTLELAVTDAGRGKLIARDTMQILPGSCQLALCP